MLRQRKSTAVSDTLVSKLPRQTGEPRAAFGFFVHRRHRVACEKSKNTEEDAPADRPQVATNTIFDTGCIGLQSCIEMQPKRKRRGLFNPNLNLRSVFESECYSLVFMNCRCFQE